MPASNFGRRKFLEYSALSLGGLFIKAPVPAPKLAFSTLGCPDWDLPEIIRFARQHGYSGLEFRGIKADMFLPDSPWFGKNKIGETKRMMADAGLQPVGLGSSAQLHHTEAAASAKHLDEARRYIDLAAELGCRNVRVFPEKLPQGSERKATLDLIVSRMQLLAAYARSARVNILVESHGDLVAADDLQYVLANVNAPNTGMIWDIVNMWVVTKEPPAVVYPKLRPYIRHVHLKDIVYEGDKFRYVLFGKGQAPVKDAMALLNKGKYNGYYSFEWEKRWHPEIEAPEEALAAYPAAFRQYADRK